MNLASLKNNWPHFLDTCSELVEERVSREVAYSERSRTVFETEVIRMKWLGGDLFDRDDNPKVLEPSPRSCKTCNPAHEYLHHANTLHVCFDYGRYWLLGKYLDEIASVKDYEPWLRGLGLKPEDSTTKIDDGIRLVTIEMEISGKGARRRRRKREALTRASAATLRGFGDKSLEKVLAGASFELTPKARELWSLFTEKLSRIRERIEQKTAAEALAFAYKESGLANKYEHGTEEDNERAENIRELVSLATKYDELPPGIGIEKLLEEAALMTDQDNLTRAKDGVRLMTVHAAKGLEFDVVFIVGLEQDLFPHSRLGDEGDHDPEEERRLFYVALTRARKKLHLSCASSRTIFGSSRHNLPSEFLGDIPTKLIEEEGPSVVNQNGGGYLGNPIDF
jgi:hypothetical protein